MGKIVCLRDNKVFTTSLMNVAHENYFYEVKELSAKERQLIEMMTITNRKEAQQKIHKTMLKLYCAPFDYLRTKSFMNSLNSKYSQYIFLYSRSISTSDVISKTIILLLSSSVNCLPEILSKNEWTIRGFIDIFRNIYPLTTDSKVISKILELHLYLNFYVLQNI